MKYEIFVLSVNESNVPYEIKNVNHLNGDIKWKFIGEIDDLNVAREMIKHDKFYMNFNNREYKLKQEPCSDMKYTYCLLKSDNLLEYYDVYHHNINCIFERRF